MIRGNNQNHPWLSLSDEQLLQKAGLWKKDFATGKEGYTLAAILLFGKDETIQQILPHYKIDALVRKDNVGVLTTGYTALPILSMHTTS